MAIENAGKSNLQPRKTRYRGELSHVPSSSRREPKPHGFFLIHEKLGAELALLSSPHINIILDGNAPKNILTSIETTRKDDTEKVITSFKYFNIITEWMLRNRQFNVYNHLRIEGAQELREAGYFFPSYPPEQQRTDESIPGAQSLSELKKDIDKAYDEETPREEKIRLLHTIDKYYSAVFEDSSQSIMPPVILRVRSLNELEALFLKGKQSMHEFNTPMTAFIGFDELFTGIRELPADARQERLINSIKLRADELNVYLQTILERLQGVYVKIPMKVSDILRNAYAQQTGYSEFHPIVDEESINKFGDLEVIWSPGVFLMTLDVIVNNTIDQLKLVGKSNQSEENTIEISAALVTETDTQQQENEFIEIYLADNAGGHIEEGTRQEKSEKKALAKQLGITLTGGLNVGISDVDEFARQYGGSVRLVNNEKGVTAIIRLPIRKQ